MFKVFMKNTIKNSKNFNNFLKPEDEQCQHFIEDRRYMEDRKDFTEAFE